MINGNRKRAGYLRCFRRVVTKNTTKWAVPSVMAWVLLGMAISATTYHAQEDTPKPNAFSPRKIIDHPLCRMGIGHRHAANIAVVVMPGATGGARFAVLDGGGTIFDGELPFFPNSHALGRGKDGSVLVGFGGSAPDKESILQADAEPAEGPVHVYRDGTLIFETDGAWQFNIASNGTSFFVVEPQAKFIPRLVIEPRLVVGNIASGTKHRFDIVDQLQDIYDAYGNDVYGRARYRRDAHTAAYSSTEDEIMIVPKYKSWGYTYNRPGAILFYSVVEGRPRFGVFSHHAALLASSSHGYFADQCMVERIVDGRRLQRDEITVVKKQFDWSDIAEKTEMVIWSRTIDLDGFLGLSLSDDGAYLILDAINLHVLDAATGETVFAFPVEANLSGVIDGKEYHWTWDRDSGERRILRDTPVGRAYHDAALKRLTNVVPLGHTINDIELGGPLAIRQGRLAMTHRVPHIGEILYLFDMNGIQPTDAPKARVELSRPVADKACVMGNIPEQGLQMRNDKLTYLTERLSLNGLRDTD